MKSIEEQTDDLFLDKDIQSLAYFLIKEYGPRYIRAAAFENLQIDGVQDKHTARHIQWNYNRELYKLQNFLIEYSKLND